MFRSEDNAYVIGFPALIKASIGKAGERLIEMECSNESIDQEGDVILQKALLNSGSSYIQNGHIDIDHYSELGKKPEYGWLRARIGNPDDWIIGIPLEVKDLGGGRTGLKSQIFKSKDGTINPNQYKYDMFWQTLQTDPPARWFASIYGFPGSDTEEGTHGVSRYIVKSFDWRSTAVTRNPINDALKSSVRIVTAKSFAANLPRQFPSDERIFTRSAIRKVFNDHLAKSCPSTDSGKSINTWTIRDHYINCDCLTYNLADVYALATSELINRRNIN